jgi:hypothetical protein
MTKIALSILALAALSTASLADRNRNDLGSTGSFRSYSGDVSVETAPLAVYGGQASIDSFEGKQGGR